MLSPFILQFVHGLSVQFCQDGNALGHLLGLDTVAHAEIAGCAEIVAGDQQKIPCLGLVQETLGIGAGDADEDVERALGLELETVVNLLV